MAIKRLNIARRRLHYGDKCIDGSICLESLLSDGSDKSELNYKYSLRSALLIGNDKDQKKEIKRIVKDFYGVRSAAVHGNKIKPKDFGKNNKIAEDGLDVCRRLIEKFIEIGSPPNMEELELTGGKSF